MTVEEQVAIIFCGTKGLLSKVPVKKVREFEVEYLSYMRNKHRDVLDTLKAGMLTDEVTSTLRKVCEELTAKYA